MKREEAIEVYNGLINTKIKEAFEFFAPELRESEDERVRKWIYELVTCLGDPADEDAEKELDEMRPLALSWLEKQKSGKPLIPEKKNDVRKAIEEVIRVYGKTQGEWIAGYDMDTLVVHLRNAFAALEKQKEQKEQKEIPMPNSTELIEMWDAEKAILQEKDFRGDTWRIAQNAFMDGFARGTCVKFEKQKEQKPNIEICPHTIKSKSYSKTGYPIENCDYGLEIALNILQKTYGKVEGYQTDDGIREHETAIQAVKDAMGGPKQEWSEEDEKMIDTIVSVLGQYIDYKTVSGTGSGYATPRYSKEIAWLKSLRPQPKQRWTMEDWSMLCDIAGYVDGSGSSSGITNQERVDFLYKLPKRFNLPQLHWKPSEEQMSALLAILNDPNNIGSQTCQLALTDLYEQLKKL